MAKTREIELSKSPSPSGPWALRVGDATIRGGAADMAKALRDLDQTDGDLHIYGIFIGVERADLLKVLKDGAGR